MLTIKASTDSIFFFSVVDRNVCDSPAVHISKKQQDYCDVLVEFIVLLII